MKIMYQEYMHEFGVGSVYTHSSGTSMVFVLTNAL